MATQDTLCVEYVEFVARGLNEVNAGIDTVQRKLKETAAIPPFNPFPTVERGGFNPNAPQIGPRPKGGDGASLAGGGFREASAGVGELQAKLAQVNAEAATTPAKLEQIAVQVKQVGVAAVAMGMMAADALTSFARAGLEGTGQMAMLHFQTQQLARGVGAALLPIIEATTATVGRLSEWFRSLTESQQNALTGLVAFAGAAKVAGMAMNALGVESALATGGISLLVGGLAAAAMAGGGMGGLGDAFSGLLDSLKPVLDALGTAFGALKPAVEGVGQVIAAVASIVGPAISAMVQVVQPLLEGLGEAFAEIAATIKEVIPQLQPVFAALAEAASIMAQAVSEAIKPLVPIFKQFIHAVADILQQLAPYFKLLGQEFAIVVQAVAPFVEGMMKSIVIVAKFAASVLKDIQPAFEAIGVAFSRLSVAVSEMGDMLRDVMSEFAVEFAGVLESLKPIIIDFANSLVANIELAVGAIQGMVAEVKILRAEGIGAAFDTGFAEKVKDEIVRMNAMAEEMRNRASIVNKGPAESGRKIEPSGGQFEGVQEMFKRIQAAAGESGSKKPEEEAVDRLDKMWEWMQRFGEKFMPTDKGTPPPAA